LAKRIQFDNSAIQFGNLIWQNEFNLTKWQFDLAKRIQFDDPAIRFANSADKNSCASILAQRFGGISGGLVARQALFVVAFYTKWYLTTKGSESWTG
jgi:hypothetical protein